MGPTSDLRRTAAATEVHPPDFSGATNSASLNTTVDFETLRQFVATSELSKWTYFRNNAGGNVQHSYEYGTDERTALKIWKSKGWTGDVMFGGVQIGFRRIQLGSEQDSQLFELIDARGAKRSAAVPDQGRVERAPLQKS